MNYLDDIQIAKAKLMNIRTEWEGKKSVLEMKEADYNWRQMEWWAFYFELLCQNLLMPNFQIPGPTNKITRPDGRVTTMHFDAVRSINWDLKAKAIKSDDHRAILNDIASMDLSISKFGCHGVIIGLCDVEYNDVNRTFQKWHQELKGGKSAYEIEREKRTSISRYRKTHATLTEILFLLITPENNNILETMNQGRNSDGTSRPPKYMINLEEADSFMVDRIVFEN